MTVGIVDKNLEGEGGIVVLSQERYDELVEAEEFLQKLASAGVDNWEGYEQALD